MRILRAVFGGDRRARALGALALLFWTLHAAHHLRTGELANLLWLSNVATLLLAVGCCIGRARWLGVVLLWSSLSALLWTVDVSVGPGVIDSAILTHLGSFALAFAAVRHFGFAEGSWSIAAGGLIALVALARVATDPRHNVNLAFAVADGWGDRFASHGAYVLGLLLLASALFFGVERLTLRALARTRIVPVRIE
jgi:hypothetical protein